MLDDPEEGLQRRRIRIDAADAEQVEMDRPWKMVLAEILGRPEVDEKRLPCGTRARARVLPA